MRQLACCTVTAVVLALAATTADAASTKAQRVAAAESFAKRTLSFERKRVAAEKKARSALATKRAAAQACVAAFKDAPALRREDLRTMYFQYLSGALWSVDAALYRSWIVDLRRSGRIDRFVTLARAADALRRQYNVANIFYKAYPDICATVNNWQHSGWTEEARRVAISGIVGTLKDPPRRGDQRVLDQASTALRNNARNGKAAAEILELGVDELDERVHFHAGCDAVGQLLFPDEYKECPAAA